MTFRLKEACPVYLPRHPLFGMANELRSRQHLIVENLALRQQVAVLSRQQRRPRLRPSDRLFWCLLSRLWSPWRTALVFAQLIGRMARGNPR